jgi:hypothetical protein
MNITRRQFLGGAVAAALVIPELVLPTTRFFLPPPGGWPKNFAEVTIELQRYNYRWGSPVTLRTTLEPGVKEYWEKVSYTSEIDGPGMGWKIIEGDTLVHEDWSDFSFPQKIRVPS